MSYLHARRDGADPCEKYVIKVGLFRTLCFHNPDDLRNPDYRPTCSCRLARSMDVQLHKQACFAAHPLSGTFITHQRRRFRAGAARRGSRHAYIKPTSAPSHYQCSLYCDFFVSTPFSVVKHLIFFYNRQVSFPFNRIHFWR